MDSALQGQPLITPRKNAWILRVSGDPKAQTPHNFLETFRPSPVPPYGAVTGASICKTVETAAPVFAPTALPCVPARTRAHALELISRVENRRPRTRHYVYFHDPPQIVQCFTMCSGQLPTAPRQQQGFPQNEASAETGAPFSRAPGASEKPLKVPKLARTSEGFLP